MKYLIENFKVNVLDNDNLELIIKNKYHLNDFKYKIINKAIDARNKEDIKYVYKLIIDTNKKLYLNKYIDNNYQMEYKNYIGKRPIIVGFGPSGMFAALYLARCNSKPIIIERGSKIEDRINDVANFLNNKKLNANSNIQFGEGGAGTFSDGKLVTNLNDKLIRFILQEFYLHGAKEDILYDSKPHIGTDYLRKIVKNIRVEIIKLGGSFYFNTTFIDFELLGDNNLNVKAKNNITNEEYLFNTSHLILGLGHSARDTISHLYLNKYIDMEPKAFSMGVRVEHNAEKINYAQYAKFAKYLPPAYYKLSVHNNNRGIYTFCMCPGGYVMASTSNEGTIVTNGMSNNLRDSLNSNSALLVDIKKEDYYVNSPLDGIYYQEKYEKLAFSLSNDYKAPANLFKEFLNDEIAKEERSIKTTYPHKLYFTDLRKCLPSFVIEGLKYGILEFDKKLKGFNDDDAIIIGIESRSSSPVRIKRNESRVSSVNGIYPIGEGAGYAGGITSAALDGLKTAMLIVINNS